MVDPVAGERDLEQRAGEAGALVDEREQAARSDVEPAQCAAQIADGFAHEPMLFERAERRVHRQNRLGLAFGLHQPNADVELVGAHRQDRVLELTGERQRIPVRALRLDRRDVLRLSPARPFDHEGRGARASVDRHLDVRIDERVGFDRLAQSASARRPSLMKGGRCLRRAPERAPAPWPETAPAWRSRRRDARPQPSRRARPRSWCRRHPRGRGGRGACRSAA